MNGSNNSMVSQQTIQPLNSGQVPINTVTGIASGMHIWQNPVGIVSSQSSDTSSRFVRLPRQTLIMANLNTGNSCSPLVRNTLTVNQLQQQHQSINGLVLATPTPETISSTVNNTSTNLNNGASLTPFVMMKSDPPSTQSGFNNVPASLSSIEVLNSADFPLSTGVILDRTPQSFQVTPKTSIDHDSSAQAHLHLSPVASQSALPVNHQLIVSDSFSVSDSDYRVINPISTSISEPGSSGGAVLSQVHDNSMVSSLPFVVNQPIQMATQSTATAGSLKINSVFSSKSLNDIIKDTDTDLQLDDDAKEVLMQLSEEFVENVASKAIRLASHRGSSIVEPRDVKFCLERDWNIFVPGFPAVNKTMKRPFLIQCHKQRLDMIKKIKRS